MSVSRFVKAVSTQARFKAALYSKQGRGKTLTALLWAEGLAARDGKRIAYIDTELGTDFYVKDIPERKVHPKAFDIDRLVTRSIMETIEAIEGIDPDVHSVVVIDSITHLWDAAIASYNGKKMSNGGIPIHAWGDIKRPYKKLMSMFLDGNFHAILCGREGVIMEKDDDGETEVVGTKIKAEGETGYEPHILGRMFHDTDEAGHNNVVTIFFEKDRSGILAGKSIQWPNYSTIEPIVKHLSGDHQPSLGTTDATAEKDAAVIESQKAAADAERQTLYETIRTAINNSRTIDELKAAIGLTKGKKTKLGEELFSLLETQKDTRKVELLRAEVA
jgi:hypothetical protein